MYQNYRLTTTVYANVEKLVFSTSLNINPLTFLIGKFVSVYVELHLLNNSQDTDKREKFEKNRQNIFQVYYDC
jgi:hypothetical protein